ncbi:MAG: hypothetical protein NWF14_05495 [Candidatus Bathyarchaeota archaeon]|nr:hypothetical protein [Candidatus Bathyarchaeota archaeon]
METILSGLVRFSFVFERFFPWFMKSFLSRVLEEYKEKGVLADYRVKAERKGKYRYSFELEIVLNIGEGGEVHGRREERACED